MIETIKEFKGKYFFLSNFYPIEIEVDGIKYPSSEHAYMSYKNESPEWKQQCQDFTITCGQIKKASRKVNLVENWDDIKFGVMFKVVESKFKNPELKLKLLETGNQILEEGNWWGDIYWGICNGKGQNNLGKILMMVRGNIRAKENTQLYLL